MLDELRRISKPRDPAPGRRAVVHMALERRIGRSNGSTRHMRRGTGRRRYYVEPLFDVVRSDPRFAVLVERVGVPR